MLAWPVGTRLYHRDSTLCLIVHKHHLWLDFKKAPVTSRKWNVGIVLPDSLLEGCEVLPYQMTCSEDPLEGAGIPIHEIEGFVLPERIRCSIIE